MGRFPGSLIHVERGYTEEGGEDLPKSYRVCSVPPMPQVELARIENTFRSHEASQFRSLAT